MTKKDAARKKKNICVSGPLQIGARRAHNHKPTCLKGHFPDLGGGGFKTVPLMFVNGLYATLSGTSMAAPHVAGVAAIAMQENPSYSSAQLRNWITSNAMSGLVNNPGTGSPNLMLHVRC